MKLSQINPLYVSNACKQHLSEKQVSTIVEANVINSKAFDTIDVTNDDLKSTLIVAHMFLSVAQQVVTRAVQIH